MEIVCQTNSRIRVLMVIPRFLPIKIGGSERQLERLCPLLVERGVSITLLTGRPAEFRYNVPRDEQVDGYRILRVFEPGLIINNKGRLNSYGFMFTLGTYLLRLRNSYDVIHEHSGRESAIVCQFAANIFKKVCMVLITGGGDNFSPFELYKKPVLGKFLFGLFLRTNNIIVLTKEIREICLKLGFKSEQLFKIPNGVPLFDLPSWDRKNEIRKELMGFSELLIVVVSNLLRIKRIDLFIDAMCGMDDTFPSFKAYVLGEGPEIDNLTESVNAKGLEGRILFPGRVEDVGAYLSIADIAVHPSSAEGMSNAILEEMSYGIPVIAADIDANREILRDGKNGFLFVNGDLRSLIAKLKCLAGNEILRRQIGFAARKTIEDRYSLDSVADRYVAVYKTLLRRKAN